MAIAGVDRGSGGNANNETSHVITPATNFDAGSLAVLCITYDNSVGAPTAGADPFSSIIDSAGNTWTPRINALNDPGAANAGNAMRIFTSDMAVATLTTSHTITVSFTDTVSSKAWALHQITPDAGFAAVYAGGNQAAQTSATPEIVTGTIPVGALVLGVIGREGNETQTDEGDATNGTWSAGLKAAYGSGTGGQEIITQRKVQTTTASTQTYSPTYGGQSRDGCNAWAMFVQNKTISPAQAVASFTGIEPSLIFEWFTIPGQVAAAFTGLAPDLSISDFRFTYPDQATATFTGLEPTPVIEDLNQPITKGVAQATLTFIGSEPQVSLSQVVSLPDQVANVFTGLAPEILVPQTIEPAPATAAFTGLAPSVLIDYLVSPGVAALNFAGEVPSLDVIEVPGFYSLVGVGIGAGLGKTIFTHLTEPATAGLSFSGHEPKAISSKPGFLSLAGGMGLGIGKVIPSGAFYSLDGGMGLGVGLPPHSSVLPIGTAELTFSGQVPTVLQTYPPTAPLTDYSLPVAWYADPGYTALYQHLTAIQEGQAAQVPISDYSIPVAWYGDPGWDALYTYFIQDSALALFNTALPGAASLQFTGLIAEPQITHIAQPDPATLIAEGQQPDFLIADEKIATPTEAALIIAGQIPDVQINYIAEPAQAELVFGGLEPSLDQAVTPDVAALVFTGLAPALDVAIIPAAAALAFTGQEPTIINPRVIEPGVAELTFTGQEPIAGLGPIKQPGVALIEFIGRLPTPLLSDFHFTYPAQGTATFTGWAPILAWVREPAQASATFTGLAPTVIQDDIKLPAQASLQFTGKAPSAEITHIAEPGAASLTFTGRAPQLSASGTASPDAAALTFTGLQPGALVSLTAFPAQATVTFTGYAPSLQSLLIKEPAQASLAFTGRAPGLVVSALHEAIPDQATAAFTGLAPTIEVGTAVQPGAADLRITGRGPQIEITHHVVKEPANAVLTITELAPNVELNAIYARPDQASAEFTGQVPLVLLALPVRGKITYGRREFGVEASRRPPSRSTSKRRNDP